MNSKILFDTRNNNIMRCQPKPHGSAELPDFKGLCKSARISEDQKQYMSTCLIDKNLLTKEAKRKYRINNNEVILKSKVNISTDKSQVDISAAETFTLSINITNVLENETLSTVDITIEDAVITIDLSNNVGSQEIELSEVGKYMITCNEDRFRSNSIEVEGV
jgi:hypothetical protein